MNDVEKVYAYALGRDLPPDPEAPGPTCADCKHLQELKMAGESKPFSWDCFEFDGSFAEGFDICPVMEACGAFEPKEPQGGPDGTP